MTQTYDNSPLGFEPEHSRHRRLVCMVTLLSILCSELSKRSMLYAALSTLSMLCAVLCR